jgi:hypothetical protein
MERKMVRIPRVFIELLGEEQRSVDLFIVGAFTLVMTVALGGLASSLLFSLVWWKIVLILLLIADISGGVVANFTRGTNDFYADRPRLRIIFLLIHVQPLVIAWFINQNILPVLAVWGYTILAGFIVNAFAHHPSQPIVGVLLLSVGWLLLAFLAGSLPFLMTAVLGLFMLKLIYAFAVNHYEFRGILP